LAEGGAAQGTAQGAGIRLSAQDLQSIEKVSRKGSYVPFSSLESVIEQSKEGYYLALRQTQITVRTEAPNWQPWVTFFLRALQQQMKRLAKKVEREKNTSANTGA
jgi:hypothetical protein